MRAGEKKPANTKKVDAITMDPAISAGEEENRSHSWASKKRDALHISGKRGKPSEVERRRNGHKWKEEKGL